MRRLLVVVCFAAAVAAGSGDGAAPAWRTEAPLPVPRTEVAGTTIGPLVVVAGGFLSDGTSSPRVDLYTAAKHTWSRAPDLPAGLNHAMAAALGGRIVVVGGYGANGPSRDVVALDVDGWRHLDQLPAARAAGGAVVLGRNLYVVGGVGPAGLARTAFAYDGKRLRWRTVPAPTPREHLAVAVARGRIYAIAGRTAGYDTNLTLVESWKPGERRWRREAPVPEARGGTGAAAVGATIVSVGGEAPQGTLRRVFAFDVVKRAWRHLADLPTARHGLAVASLGRTVYVIGGGPEPGLHVSGANESLTLG